MKRALPCSSLLVLLIPATALAWPSSDQWDALTIGGVDITDGEGDHTTASSEYAWDIVGNASNPAVEWYLDEEYLYFQVLLNGDPDDLSRSFSGSWGLLFEADGDTTTFENAVSLASSGDYLLFYENTDAGTGIDETAETYLGQLEDPLDTSLAEVDNLGGTIFKPEDDAHLRLALPLDDLYTFKFIDEYTTFQVCVATSSNGDGDEFDEDAAGTSSFSGLSSCLADPISVDGDYDGLTWFVEVDEWGTDPELSDTDMDGVDDGVEIDEQDSTGCPDPLDEDSDDDGLLDGEEYNDHGTDLCNGDSDKDMVGDADEIEYGLDPLSGDSDKDGIGDYDEINCEFGGAEADADDRDQDGISDETEGTDDIDGDKRPNWCDDDSDGDGKPDADEGEGDEDCDGIVNYLDEADDDGECPDTGDSDADTDADTDTDTDTDADTDTSFDSDPDACDSGEDYCGGKLTGGGCHSAVGAALLIPAVLGGLLLGLRRRWRRLLPGLTLLAFVSVPEVRAQGLDAQALSPSIDGDRLLVLDDAAMAPKDGVQVGGGVLFNYGANPVIYRLDNGDEQSVVDGLGTLNALVFFRPQERLRLGLDMPLNPVLSGDGVEGSHLLGDIALDTKVVMLDRRDGLGLSASARLTLPTGNTDAWAGDGGLSARALLGASTTIGFESNPEAIVLAANAGLATGRSSDDLAEAFDLSWGMRLPFGVGASFAFAKPVWATAELSGAWVMGNKDQPGATPLEGLLSLGLRPTKDLLVTLGGGLPLSQGIGTPDMRGIAGLRWVPRPRKVRTWNLPQMGSGATGGDVIPAGKGRLSVRAQQVRGGGEEPLPVQATVVVLGTISHLDRRHHEVGRPPRREACKGDGKAKLELVPGEYTVRVVAEGYQPATSTVTIRAGHALPLEVDLEPVERAKFTAGAQGQVELLPSQGVVRFPQGAKTLSVKDKDALVALTSWWSTHLPGTFLVITGYASEKELVANPALHEQRALAVKEMLSLPTGFTHCQTHRQGSCGNPQDDSACYKVVLEVTDLACPDLRPPGPPPPRPPRR